MENKELLEKLCKSYEKSLNKERRIGERKEVTFFSGMKPSGYYLPLVQIGKYRPNSDENAWFVEIGVNNRVLFRRSTLLKGNEDLDAIEGFLIDRIIEDIFACGMIYSAIIIDKTKTLQ